MIKAIHTATVYVRDQDRALDFYLSKLGFEKLRDDPMGPDSRWIEIAPPGADTRILLYKPTPDNPGAETYEMAQNSIGVFSTVLFRCDDVQATYKDLSAKGVSFPQPAEQQPWGWWAVLEDSEGNKFGLTQG